MPKITNGFQLSTIFTESSILDVWGGSEYATDISPNINHFLTRFNALQTGVAYLYPLKTSESLKVFLSWVSPNKVAGLQHAIISKKRDTNTSVFLGMKFAIFLTTFFLQNTSGWLLQTIYSGKTKVSSSKMNDMQQLP